MTPDLADAALSTEPERGPVPPRPVRRRLPRLIVSVRRLFRLQDDTDEEGAIQQITASIEFRGAKLWALVSAIVVASIGLDVNSTAVVVGAMLISPLMGPIMGAGLGLGINDIALLRRSVRNVAVAASVSVITSAIYFLLSPLAEAQSELLARTRPTIFDVLIALAGGTAGIVASTRRGDRGTIIPGVAIATALMPPLCTAGYGLANGDAGFFFGALYLFIINATFICLATLGVVRILSFRQVVDLDPAHARQMRLRIVVATAFVVVPSVFVAWRVVVESRYEAAARRYVAENFVFADRSVVATSVRFGRDSSTVEATLLGQPLPPETLELLRQRMAAYGLKRTRLVVHQPDAGDIAPEQLGQMVRTGILEDLYRRNEAALADRDARIRLLEGEVQRLRSSELPMGTVTGELAALFPALRSLMYGEAMMVSGSESRLDSAQTVVATWARLPPLAERERIQAYLSSRLGVDSLRIRHVLER